ncbi:hypothetical protein SERLA73DRAFT_133200 [Serpula lacrymans var. lacrymans S7.3]|uniref:Uncharacterized protein n=2 Tax=Serpula lacrymans var. lacrymans TaxID=341189 RepID=F8PQS9_SERL3|nr:uncharacterized protein SERLADRAFT_383932 [Serpula lacrymans var. lacrymans S7.9]EGO02273.1 hypothetical protein SERLA73DRAFT_133200 [Serpula lacrymans var. lacrymans S7.3]EGO28017.1 hypothetical protein SERLADRAFT_383932 [Serpula lacrymans var. lacrymans S7.9]
MSKIVQQLELLLKHSKFTVKRYDHPHTKQNPLKTQVNHYSPLRAGMKSVSRINVLKL